MMRTDLALYAAVSAAVRAALGVAAAQVTVVVRDGVVTLSGVVSTPDEKVAADRAVARVPGVDAVAQELAVRTVSAALVSDEMLARAALEPTLCGLGLSRAS